MAEGLRERRRHTTREALERAALRLFARDGFDATTVEAIAAEAGVSPRTFFRYFAAKDEVLAPQRELRQADLRRAVLAVDDTTLGRPRRRAGSDGRDRGHVRGRAGDDAAAAAGRR